ncbi:MAG TPA: 2-oxoacid:ferredoxin oxidoreductase subunit beta [Phycisphaerae bacterium]|nr:2-oxoacid:ferredoxin oxidoreductase subunit beta [Phycisphaerae bacterium]
MATPAAPTPLTPKDFASEQDPRWCPGCGDYSILAQVRKVLPTLGIPREKFVFVSGIGCSSRFPYYLNTYGIHGIHGRALPIATGVKCTRPDLSVWVITGDGDCLSIGGNHFIHAVRRNIDVKVLLFNNRIYGLTKGQYSPTSELGKKTKSSPYGVIDNPIGAISLALGAEASFVARSVDVDVKHLTYVLERAAAHRGTAFVEIYQDCNVFNHLAFEYATNRESKLDSVIYLEHGKPLIFGKNRDKGIRLRGMTLEVVTLGNGVREQDLLVHDESAAEPALAFALSRMRYPQFPEPLGVFRCVPRPSYDALMQEQVDAVIRQQGRGDLARLLDGGETWTVE